jgi:hypothetical protein
MTENLQIKNGTVDSLAKVTSQTKRWRIGFLDSKTFVDFESDSLWVVLRVMFTYWRSHRKTWRDLIVKRLHD